jgi:hypothetical protein
MEGGVIAQSCNDALQKNGCSHGLKSLNNTNTFSNFILK